MSTMKKPFLVEEGVYSVPIFLSSSLKPRRRQFVRTLLAAQRRIVKFADRFGWKDLTLESFLDCARIFDTKADFDNALAKIAGLPSSAVFPKTYSAALECRVLMAVSPELYAENYPEGIEENSFEKLLAHEIAHRLHIRILRGNEDAMGPIWFFEGFATFAAEQFKGLSGLKGNEIREILSDQERGSYRKYAGVFRFFAEKASVEELVRKASKENFSAWLLSLVSLQSPL